LTHAASANPLLPDYQIHNPNIFSLVDNFAYQENSQTKYLDEAKADYCIIGYLSLAVSIVSSVANGISSDGTQTMTMTQ